MDSDQGGFFVLPLIYSFSVSYLTFTLMDLVMVLFLSRYTLIRLSFGPCPDLVRSCFGKHPNEVRTRCERKRTESGRRVEGDQNDRRGRCLHRPPFLPRHRLSVSVPVGVDLGRALPRWRTRRAVICRPSEKLSFNGIANYVPWAKNVVPGSWK